MPLCKDSKKEGNGGEITAAKNALKPRKPVRKFVLSLKNRKKAPFGASLTECNLCLCKIYCKSVR